MTAIAQAPRSEGRVVIPGTWTAFVELLEAKGDASWPKLAYWQRQIEIEMAPGRRHETTKKRIAQLLEVYCDVAGVDLEAWGGTTLKRPGAAGAEPDESYALFGQQMRPDLVIEVIVTSGSIDKLDIYAALAVPEVWLWTDREGLSVHVLDGDRHIEVPSSRLLPDLDLELFLSHIDEPKDRLARAAYRAALSRSRSPAVEPPPAES